MYFATAPCTSLWTQLPHQDDHQSLNKTQTCQREHYVILFSDPVILNAYENKYRDVSHSPGGALHPAGHAAKTSGRRTLRKTKQQFLVLVDFVKKQWGLWRGTAEVPLWQASSLSGISRVPANPAVEEGAWGRLDQPASRVPREGRVVLLLKVRWLYLRPRASGIPTN